MFAASKTASVSGGYQISRSLRFNSADSAYLNRTPASATNRTTWTWSGWVKRSSFGTDQQLFSAGGSGAFQFLYQSSTECLQIYDSVSSTTSVITTQVFRDPSAWYHVVLATDTTQATASNRFKLYINGSQVTSFGTATYPAQNSTLSVNNTVNHSVGSWSGAGGGNFFSGYMTEVNFIDGQALTPSSFGETNAQTGVWQPKAYAGSYGTNGFYLNFSDNSNTTAATLGKDYSGNGNNWTPNNFSVTAGAGNDSLVDSPTSYGTDTGVGGEVRGNYNTWNPLQTIGGTGGTVSNGNLDFSIGTSQNNVASTLFVTTGKWYCEITATTISGTCIGEITINDSNGNIAVGYRSTGTKDVDSYSTNAAYGATWAVGDTIGVAFDVDNKQVTFYKNGTSQGAITYTGSALTTNSMGVLCAWRTSATFAGTANFGQRPFAYTAPSGYKALCTQNLPTPTIGATTATQAGKYFNTVLYTGTDNAQTITGVGFQPDYVWLKNRTAANAPKNLDVLRGAGWSLSSAETGAEANQTNAFTAFTSDGFSVATNGGEYNASGRNYVAWNWKANGSGSTNTAGSITSTVSANTTSGFSVVTFTTPSSSANVTIGHGLGVAPSMIITRGRNQTVDWCVYHASLGNTKGIFLNQTLAGITSSAFWNNTSPTSDVFTITVPGVMGTSINGVAYCFAEVAWYSKFGSYTGNGSTNFIYTGFRPAYVLIRRTNIAAGWGIIDSARNAYNSANKYLNANASDAEGVGTAGSQYVDLLSNGFKCLDSSAGFNASGDTYIYMAFAEVPLKFSLAR